VFYGETGETVATNILSSIVKGAGYDVVNKVAPIDRHIEGIEICRPLIDHVKKEVKYIIFNTNLNKIL
jgi:tRNA(Ile)-lysidine synthase TilS/MesJ